ncbi:MAG TPA: hypothetical protein VLJ80_07490, partial [Solirubrobacteraceae bacterium]|nr:hypothetical protein [Solirubrobacteraceae bacterium]
MPSEQDPGRGDPRPRYTRYRARRRLFGEREAQQGQPPRRAADGERPERPERGARRGLRGGGGGRRSGAGGPGRIVAPGRSRAQRFAGWWRRLTFKRAVLCLIGLIFAWLALSLVLFLISSHFERTAPPKDVAGVLDPAGFPLTSANNILVL